MKLHYSRNEVMKRWWKGAVESGDLIVPLKFSTSVCGGSVLGCVSAFIKQFCQLSFQSVWWAVIRCDSIIHAHRSGLAGGRALSHSSLICSKHNKNLTSPLSANHPSLITPLFDSQKKYFILNDSIHTHAQTHSLYIYIPGPSVCAAPLSLGLPSLSNI